MSREDCESAAADLKQPDAMADYDDEELQQVASYLRDRISELTHGRNYREAKIERALIDAISQELQQRKLDAMTPAAVDEPTAEDREVQLDHAYEARQEKLDASWAGKESAMQRRQIAQGQQLDDIWTREYTRRSQKRSNRLLNMDYVEEHLGYAQDFDGAEVVRGEVDDLQLREAADAQESLNYGYEMARCRLKTDHIAERALFHQTKEHWDQVNTAWRDTRLCTIDNRARVLKQRSQELVPQREDSAHIIAKRPPPIGAKVHNRRDKANNPSERLLPPLLRPTDRANNDAKRRRRQEQRARNQKFRERQEQKAKQADSSAPSSARRGDDEQQPDTHKEELSHARVGPDAPMNGVPKNDVEEEHVPAGLQKSHAAVANALDGIVDALATEPGHADAAVQESPATVGDVIGKIADAFADQAQEQSAEETPEQAVDTSHTEVEHVMPDMMEALTEQQHQAEMPGQRSPTLERGGPEQQSAADALGERDAPQPSIEPSEALIEVGAESLSQEQRGQSQEEAAMGALDSAFGDIAARLAEKLPGGDDDAAGHGKRAPRSDMFQLTQWQDDRS